MPDESENLTPYSLKGKALCSRVQMFCNRELFSVSLVELHFPSFSAAIEVKFRRDRRRQTAGGVIQIWVKGVLAITGKHVTTRYLSNIE